MPAFAGMTFVFALAGCAPSLATRYAAGNQALSTGEGPVYLVVLSPVLLATLNECVPVGTPGAAKVLVIVADIDAAGAAANVAVEPDSPGSDCVRERLRDTKLPKPPLSTGMQVFPIGLRIDTR